MQLATAEHLSPPLARCQDCGLLGCPIVLGNGPKQADLVIVGEAPGREEVGVGRGFVGRSGQLLDRALSEVGLSRKDIAFSNAVLCHPPENRTPDKDEIAACNERLIAEVLAYQPKVVLGLGATALSALTVTKGRAGAATISSQRGIMRPWLPPTWVEEQQGKRKIKTVRVRQEGEEQGVFLMPTWHPAYILRSPTQYTIWVQDLHAVADYLRGDRQAILSTAEVGYVICSTLQALTRELSRFQSTVISVDVETASDDSLLCVGLCDVPESGPVVIVPQELLYVPEAKVLLSQFLSTHQPMGHNLRFDTKSLWRAGIACHVGEDTLLAHYSLVPGNAPDDGHESVVTKRGLKVLAQQILGVDDWATSLKPYTRGGKWEDVPRAILFPYNAKDVAYTARIYGHIDTALRKDADALRVYRELLLPATNVLAKMEYLGVRIDREALEALGATLEDDRTETLLQLRQIAAPEIEALEAELNAARTDRMTTDPREFTPGSWQQVSNLVYQKLKMPRPMDSRGGGTDEATLTAIANAAASIPGLERGAKIVGLLLDFRHTQKLLSTYVVAFQSALDSEDRLHASFNLHTTSSGRLSSSSPNLQNQPKRRGAEVRNLFVATPGYTLVEADLSQAEVRTAAGLSGDPNLIAVVQEGGDMHRANAARIFNKRPEDVTDKERQVGKSVTFSTLYGADAPKVAQISGLPLHEAEEVIARFFAAYPRLKEFFKYLEAEVVAGRPIITPYGRKRTIEYLPTSGKERGDILRSIANYPVQSTASDITLSSLVRIGGIIDWKSVRLLLTVHDSMLFEVNASVDPVEFAHWVTAEMVRVTPFPDVPFVADAKIGERWGSLKEVT